MNAMERMRMNRISTMGCAACAHLGIVTPCEERHHLLIGGQRAGDWFTIPLCRGHHQGDRWHEHIPKEYRVSLKHGRKLFDQVIATERDLWERVQQCLGLAWPESKVVPRRVA